MSEEENFEQNDAAFFKEVELEPYSVYCLSCMIKTENIKPENNIFLNVCSLLINPYIQTAISSGITKS